MEGRSSPRSAFITEIDEHGKSYSDNLKKLIVEIKDKLHELNNKKSTTLNIIWIDWGSRYYFADVHCNEDDMRYIIHSNVSVIKNLGDDDNFLLLTDDKKLKVFTPQSIPLKDVYNTRIEFYMLEIANKGKIKYL